MDPRGRRAKYCSDACRTAASRERARQRHAQELATAQQQAAVDMRTPEQMLADIRTELLIVAKIIRDRGEIPDAVRSVVSAAQAVTTAAQNVAAPAPVLNRRERRKKR